MPALKIALTLGGELFEIEGDLVLTDVRAFFRSWVNAQMGFDLDAPDLEDLTDRLAAVSASLRTVVATVQTSTPLS